MRLITFHNWTLYYIHHEIPVPVLEYYRLRYIAAIYVIMHTAQFDKPSLRFALTKDTPNLALTGELWGVYRDLYE